MPLKHPLTKLYYSIGEVAAMFDVNTSLIRFWEKEFPQLKPGKNNSGIRKYTKKDVEIFHKIYHLLKEEGYTIDGAKKHFKEVNLNDTVNDKLLLINKLYAIKTKLLKLKSTID
jgi:DNA-binding transcriptional MerR regulator